MRVLAFDVSVFGVSVSIFDTESQHLHINRLETDRGQAEFLIPMIDQCATESNLGLKDLDCIAVTRGPGSFTGVRIGLATARSLGLALNIPVLGISTLDVIARSTPDNKNTLFLIDTKRGDFYGQVGEGTEPRIWGEEDIKNHAGNIVKDAMPDISVLAKMGAEIYQGKKGYHISDAPTPLYLRGAEVSQSKREAPPVCFTDFE